MNDQPIAKFSPQPWLAAWTLAKREVLRFFRQRNRIIGSIGTPLMFWVLFGLGLNKSFGLSAAGATGQSYLQYYFAGSLMLIVLFTAIFSSISIIEDRREGFLQGVLVAPIPRWSMVLGKVLGGTFIALFQACIFLLLAFTLPIHLRPVAVLQLMALLAIAGLALTSLGFVIAWRMDSTQGFHAIMNLVLMPMWLTSGAVFPIPAVTVDSPFSERLLNFGMRANPLSYAVAGARQLLDASSSPEGFWLPSLATCWGVTLVFAVTMFVLSTVIAKGRTAGDLL